jgi:ketosteroid isomerase-like protein
MSSPDREATINELFARLSAHEWEAAGLLTADDVEFELAYAPDFMDMPVRGRAALVNLYASILGPMFDSFTIAPDEIILGADPDIAVVTYASDATVKHNGKPYRNRYVGIFRFRDGEIVGWREYHNPEETTRALSA